MPIYIYRCKSCDAPDWEVQHSMTDDTPVLCDECGEQRGRVPQAAGVVLKGSGFYNTDRKGSIGSEGVAPSLPQVRWHARHSRRTRHTRSCRAALAQSNLAEVDCRLGLAKLVRCLVKSCTTCGTRWIVGAGRCLTCTRSRKKLLLTGFNNGIRCVEGTSMALQLRYGWRTMEGHRGSQRRYRAGFPRPRSTRANMQMVKHARSYLAGTRSVCRRLSRVNRPSRLRHQDGGMSVPEAMVAVGEVRSSHR